MVDDPLQKPLATWSTEDVSSLIGRSEGQQLEVKGPELDITKPGDRKRVAQEVAGMMSADGGFVILGATENDDVIDGLPGLDIDDPVVARLRSSLLDSVYPHPVVGVRAFPTPEGNSMVVLQIQPHPLGLPACVDGRFYRRSADQNREMTYDEVRRRFQSSSDGQALASTAAYQLALDIRVPFESAARIEPSFYTVLKPIYGPGDLGTTAGQMQDTWREVAAVERTIWAQHFPRWDNWGPVLTGSKTSANGLDIGRTGRTGQPAPPWYMRFTHSGAAIGIIDLGASLDSDPGDHHLPLLTATGARFAALGLTTQRRLGVGGPIFISMDSGGVTGLTDYDRTATITSPMPRAINVHYEFSVPLWGSTAESLVEHLSIFSQRILDGLEYAVPLGDLASVRNYLIDMLGN